MVWAVGCVPALPESIGAQCELNSECATPLVCRFQKCRVECSSSRDCAAGLDCLLDGQGGGVCQLPEDASCVRDADCPEQLVCTMGECTNECACTDASVPCFACPPGAVCAERDEGGRGCVDTSTKSCVRNSDCPPTGATFVCAPDQRCRAECRTDEDCRFDDVCATIAFAGEDAGTTMGEFCLDPLRVAALDGGIEPEDAGVSDAGPTDAGADDGGTEDSGAEDSGAGDGG